MAAHTGRRRGTTQRHVTAGPGSDAGFTLVELLVAMTLGVIVVGAAVMVFTSLQSSEPRISARSAQIEQGRVMLERVTRELRQGDSVLSASPSQLTLTTYVGAGCSGGGGTSAPSELCRVTYQCSGGDCTRTVSQLSGGGANSTRVISGLADDAVFEFSPSAANPNYVGVRLAFDGRDGNESVTLEDGVALRNARSG